MPFVDQNDAGDYLTGKTSLGEIVNLGGGGASAPGGDPITSVAGTAARTSAEAPTPPTTPVSEPPSDPGAASLYRMPSVDSGSLRENIFGSSDIAQAEAGQASQGAMDQFYDAAGPLQAFESLGGEETIETALSSGDLDPAKGMFGAQYQGPMSISDEDARGIFQQLSQQAEYLQSPGGLETMVADYTQGLTPGERVFESRRMYEDPEFMARGREEIGQSRALAGAHDRGTAGAMEHVQAQIDAAADTRGRTEEYLRAGEGVIDADLLAETERLNAQNQSVRDMDAAMRADGTISPNELANTFAGDPNRLENFAFMGGDIGAMFGSPGSQKYREGQAKLDEIMGRYDDIKDIPLLTPMITQRGSENWGVEGAAPGDWFDASDIPGITPAQAQRVRDRQQETEFWFRSHPGAEDGRQFGYAGGGQEQQPQREVFGMPIGFAPETAAPSSFSPAGDALAPPSAGEFSDVMPMYGDSFSPTEDMEISSMLKLDEGTLASRENVSTQEQRTRYNRIQEVLGEIDRLEESGEPFRAAKIAMDVEGYLDAEEKAIADNKDKAAAGAEDWIGKVNGLRKKYNKKKKSAQFSTVMGVISDIMAPGIKPTFDAFSGDFSDAWKIALPDQGFGGIGVPLTARESQRGAEKINPGKEARAPSSFKTI